MDLDEFMTILNYNTGMSSPLLVLALTGPAVLFTTALLARPSSFFGEHRQFNPFVLCGGYLVTVTLLAFALGTEVRDKVQLDYTIRNDERGALSAQCYDNQHPKPALSDSLTVVHNERGVRVGVHHLDRMRCGEARQHMRATYQLIKE